MSAVEQLKDIVSKQSVPALARRTGIPRRSIQSILDGNLPSLEKAEKICRAAGQELYLGPPRTQPGVNSGLTPNAPPPDNMGIISVSPVDVRATGGLIVKCPLLREVLAQLCEEWVALDPGGKKKLYKRFRSYFPELANEHVVTRIAWEAVAAPPEPPAQTDSAKPREKSTT